MIARDLMTPDVVWIDPSASIAVAARTLSQGRARSLLVGHAEHPPHGIVTAVDVVRATLGSALQAGSIASPQLMDRLVHTADVADARMVTSLAHAAVSTPVSSVMISPVHCVREEASAAEVTDLLIRCRMETVPVLAGDRVIGVIHPRALLGALDRLLSGFLCDAEA